MGASTVLCVDDQVHVLDSLRRVFLDDGYHLLTASRAEEALEVILRHPVDLIISDYRMPGLTGADLLSKVHQEQPGIIGIILSGYVKAEKVAELIEADIIYTFVAKPWHDDELRLTVKRALEHRRARQELAQLRAELQLKER